MSRYYGDYAFPISEEEDNQTIHKLMKENTMKKYEVTGYLQIPVFVTVEADNAAEALEKGSDEIEMGFGTQGEQYWQDEYSVWDMEADRPADNEIDYNLVRETK
jgi:hypothetical protein